MVYQASRTAQYSSKILHYISIVFLFCCFFPIQKGQAEELEIYQPYFRGISEVALYVDEAPAIYQEALRCFNRENECADEQEAQQKKLNNRDIPHEERVQYISTLKKASAEYPISLHRDILQKGLTKHTNEQFSRFIKNFRPILVDDNTALDKYLKKPGTLTIVLETRFIKDTTSPAVVLNYWLYRPDIDPVDLSRMQRAWNFTTVISLAQKEKNISEAIAAFFKNFELLSSREIQE